MESIRRYEMRVFELQELQDACVMCCAWRIVLNLPRRIADASEQDATVCIHHVCGEFSVDNCRVRAQMRLPRNREAVISSKVLPRQHSCVRRSGLFARESTTTTLNSSRCFEEVLRPPSTSCFDVMKVNKIFSPTTSPSHSLPPLFLGRFTTAVVGCCAGPHFLAYPSDSGEDV